MSLDDLNPDELEAVHDACSNLAALLANDYVRDWPEGHDKHAFWTEVYEYLVNGSED